MRNYPTNKNVYNHIDQIWYIDLIDKVRYKKSNNKGLRYIFIMIDKLSKFLWCAQLKHKNSQTVTDEFSNFLTTSRQSPLKIESHRGSKCYTSIFQNFLKSKNIQHYLRFTDRVPSLAEKVIRTKRKSLKKPVFEEGNADWLNELPSVIKKYNDTIYNSKKKTPNQASEKLMKN